MISNVIALIAQKLLKEDLWRDSLLNEYGKLNFLLGCDVCKVYDYLLFI